MSKVNVDEIKVGDLVEMPWFDTKWLCYVTKVDKPNDRFFGYWSDDFEEEWDTLSDLTGHWKVINFEEEKQMDELKVYTGKETIEALLEGKVLYSNGLLYRFIDNLQVDFREGKGWEESQIEVNSLLGFKSTEVATPQVGDWVRVTAANKSYVGELLEVDGEWLRANWNGRPDAHGVRLVFSSDTWEILTPEQVSEYKREQAFVKVGRKLNEYKCGDIVIIVSLGVFAMVISKKTEGDMLLNVLNDTGKGKIAKPHQLIPISFVEDQIEVD